MLREKGWRAVLPPGSDEDGESELPPLAPGRDDAEGVAVANRQAEVKEDRTRPPPRITEARLLSLMENAGQQIEDEDIAAVLHEKGIGTPATRADIIENLIAKGYVVRVDRALRPTVKGIRLIDTLNRIQVDRLTSPELTGDIEYHLLQVERGARSASDFMAEIVDYTSEIVERAKNVEYDELYDPEDVLGSCPKCGRPVIEMAWFYRCQPVPGADEAADCPVRFWKDTSGRYLDRETVKTLLRDHRTGELDGFTARNGRTYRATLELDPEEAFKVRVKSLGYDEGSVSDQPEYEVNPEPLGACPFEEDCRVVESTTLFVCERTLKDDNGGAPRSCGFVLPRTVCKREIVRDEALVYLRTGKTGLLSDFTSRFGRPFAATLVLKKTGRHGFEFQPREARGPRGARRASGAADASGAAAEGAEAPRTRPRKVAARKRPPAAEAPVDAADAPRTPEGRATRRSRPKRSPAREASEGAPARGKRRKRAPHPRADA
jgi:DNA topoisomerase-3